MKRLKIKIYGQVQGVFFRQGANEMIRELGLAGTARNEPDGSVEIEVGGRKTSWINLRTGAATARDWPEWKR